MGRIEASAEGAPEGAVEGVGDNGVDIYDGIIDEADEGDTERV